MYLFRFAQSTSDNTVSQKSVTKITHQKQPAAGLECLIHFILITKIVNHQRLGAQHEMWTMKNNRPKFLNLVFIFTMRKLLYTAKL